MQWRESSGELVTCPRCGNRLPLVLGSGVTVSVRVHPKAKDRRKHPPSAPHYIALYHGRCGTALELAYRSNTMQEEAA